MTSNVHSNDIARPGRRGSRLAMILVSGALLSGAAILPASAATVSAMPAAPVASVVQSHDWHHHDHDYDHHHDCDYNHHDHDHHDHEHDHEHHHDH